MKILINGSERNQISVLDRGFAYGDGLFETVRVIDGRIPLLEHHLHRLARSCERLHMDYPGDHIFNYELFPLCEHYSNAVLKIILTRGVSDTRGYIPPENTRQNRILIISPQPVSSLLHEKEGIETVLCEYRLARNSQLAGIKHLSMLEYVLASAELKSKSVQEGLLRDTKGFLIEGTSTNVFLFTKGKLYTPDLTYAGIEGVMRNCVLRIAKCQGIKTEIRNIDINVLYAAEEVFITNSTRGVWPVIKIDSTTFNVGHITRKLQNAVGQLFHGGNKDVS